MKLQTLAVVLPRYGASLGGGAEALAKALLEHIALDTDYGPALVEKAEVWTTCAKDHRTWDNYYPAGVSEEDGICVRRFPVSERNVSTFIEREHAIQDGRPLSVSEQLDWLAASVNSNELYQHIEQNGKSFDALLFAPYLFATSFWGALIHPERSVMIPCLHNEPYAYQSVFQALFRRVRGILYNADAERELAEGLYGCAEKGSVVGMGFEPLADRPELDLTERFPEITKPYVLYSGRKEQGKNVDLLIDYMEHYQTNVSEDLQLVLIGAGDIGFRDSLPSGVIDLGFVSEDEKHALFESATLLCQPSVNESFSIVLMESWQHGTPALVHGNCAVTREHVVKSGGGLYFSDCSDFCGAVQQIADDADLRRRLGRAGKRYVAEEYSWNAVRGRFCKAFETLESLDASRQADLQASLAAVGPQDKSDRIVGVS